MLYILSQTKSKGGKFKGTVDLKISSNAFTLYIGQPAVAGLFVFLITTDQVRMRTVVTYLNAINYQQIFH